jgi:hypothetical protein
MKLYLCVALRKRGSNETNRFKRFQKKVKKNESFFEKSLEIWKLIVPLRRFKKQGGKRAKQF